MVAILPTGPDNPPMLKNTKNKESNEGGNGAASNAGDSQMRTLLVVETFADRFGNEAFAVRDEDGIVTVALTADEAAYCAAHNGTHPVADPISWLGVVLPGVSS